MSSDPMSSLVKGEIVIGKEISSFSGAQAHIYLEDVSLADAPAKILAQQTISDIAHETGTEQRLQFDLSGLNPRGRASYSLRVHISRQGNRDIQLGDCITMESYPVLSRGNPNQATIFVREVK